MNSTEKLVNMCRDENVGLFEAILSTASNEQGTPPELLRDHMNRRLKVLRQTLDEAERGSWSPKLVLDDSKLLKQNAPEAPLSGSLVFRASQMALALGVCNASMGRIVAAPTAGSCGILPGLMFAWQECREGSDEVLLEGLFVAAALGEIIAYRASLSGAEGGCQAECGSAAAMGAAALCHMEGGSPEAVFHAGALSLKSVLGLVCDPVAGLVEVPCIKRNGLLVSLGALSADMALAGVRSVIPPDEVIDAMDEVGRAIPVALRETSRGGLATTPTGTTLYKDLLAKVENYSCSD